MTLTERTLKPETLALLRLLRDLDERTLVENYQIHLDPNSADDLDRAMVAFREAEEPAVGNELVSVVDVRIEVSRILEELRVWIEDVDPLTTSMHAVMAMCIERLVCEAYQSTGARSAVFAGFADGHVAEHEKLRVASLSRASTFSYRQPLPPPGQFWRHVIWGDENSLVQRTGAEVDELIEERDLEQGILAVFGDRLRPVQDDDTPTRWLAWRLPSNEDDGTSALFERGDGQWVSRTPDATVLEVGTRVDALRALASYLEGVLEHEVEATGWFNDSLGEPWMLTWRAHPVVAALYEQRGGGWVAAATDGSILKIGSRTECLAKLLEAHS